MIRAVFTWLSKGIGFGFGFGFTTPFGWLVYLLWFWFYDSQVKTALRFKTDWKASIFSTLHTSFIFSLEIFERAYERRIDNKKERKTPVGRLTFHKMNSYKKIMFDKNKESEKAKFIS